VDFWWQLALAADAVLIAPFRWPDDPVAGWWLGAAVLAAWAVVLGDLTLAAVFRINRKHVDRANRRMRKLNQQALGTLQAGDKAGYRALNHEANEAFGKAFFLQIAMGAAGLWPAFLAAGWLQARFAGVAIAWPGGWWETGYLPAFVVLYLLMRLAAGWLKKRLGLAARTRALWEGLKQVRRQRRGGP
jgi:hypothetical protein